MDYYLIFHQDQAGATVLHRELELILNDDVRSNFLVLA